MKTTPISVILLALLSLSLPACNELDADSHVSASHTEGEHSGGEHAHPAHKILVTSPVEEDVISTQPYVCQIHSRRHIEVCALEGGYLEEIKVQEGQAVKEGESMFKILPVLLEAKLKADVAEAELAQIEYNNSKKLFDDHVVSDQELALAKAKLAKAQAKVELARAERNFADIKAPFDGIVDRQLHQQGSLIEEGDVLTTMSDNSVMWVYFNVPEARYLEYVANDASRDPQHPQQLRLPNVHIELQLADGRVFNQTAGDVVTIEGDFDNETGNIAFRADFPNPQGLLRYGQTGTILIHRELDDAIIIPQRATYETLSKQYVYVVDKDNVVHQREIVVEQELEDIYVIKEGLNKDDRIVFEGIRQVRDGDKVEYEFLQPEEAFSHLKHHAE